MALADESEFDFVPLLAVGTAYQITPNMKYIIIFRRLRPKIFTRRANGKWQVVNDDLEEGKSCRRSGSGAPKPLLVDVCFYMEFGTKSEPWVNLV